MSKMNELSIEAQEALYDQYIEDQREELRKEGADELRNEILRELKYQSLRAWDTQTRHGIETAIVVVEQATR